MLVSVNFGRRVALNVLLVGPPDAFDTACEDELYRAAQVPLDFVRCPCDQAVDRVVCMNRLGAPYDMVLYHAPADAQSSCSAFLTRTTDDANLVGVRGATAIVSVPEGVDLSGSLEGWREARIPVTVGRTQLCESVAAVAKLLHARKCKRVGQRS